MAAVPPPMQGQVQAPNPIELLWEKYRRPIQATGILALVAIAASYAIDQYRAKQAETLWSGVAQTTGLDQGYVAEASSAGWIKQLRDNEQFRNQFNWASNYFPSARDELVTSLRDDVGQISDASIEDGLSRAKGTAAEPLVLWIKAVRARDDDKFDVALAALDELEKRFPNHFLTAVSAHPPQFQSPAEKAPKPAVRNRKPEQPKLLPPVQGSPVSQLRAQIATERDFRAAHPSLYQAPEPDPSPTAVLKLSTGDTIKIRFYRGQAPKHVDSFIERVRAGFYSGQRIDEVYRKAGSNAVEQFHFGLASSTSEDRSTWTKTSPSSVQLEFEGQGLSHFAGMVAAAQDPDGKSSGERVWINANDEAAELDGQRTIFGRVVEGLDVVGRICRDSPFMTEEMRASGRGQLQLSIEITSAVIEE